jgi:nucleotide-binding universal stress UspA family protein
MSHGVGVDDQLEGVPSFAPRVRELGGPHMHAAKRILCPTDFSRHSRHALRKAAAVARASGAQVILFHVFPQTTPGGMSEDSYLLANWRQFMKREEEHARAALEREARSRFLQGVKVRTVMGAGSPYREIARVASRMHVDLIVISTHGATGLLHLVLGSVAERVVRHAPCSVLVVKPARGGKAGK